MHTDNVRDLLMDDLVALGRRTSCLLPAKAGAVVAVLTERLEDISGMLCQEENAIAERATKLAAEMVAGLHKEIEYLNDDLAEMTRERDALRAIVNLSRRAYMHSKHGAACPGLEHDGCHEYDDGDTSKYHCLRGLSPDACEAKHRLNWSACRCGLAEMGEALGLERYRAQEAAQ